MWRIASRCLKENMLYGYTKCGRSPFINARESYFRSHLHRVKKYPTKGQQITPSFAYLIFGGVGYVSIKLYSVRKAFCEAAKNNEKSLIAKTLHQPALNIGKFNWQLFAQLLRSDIWLLALAIGAALVVAVLNVNLPLQLGNLVNVLTRFASSSAHDVEESFFHLMTPPVVKLLTVYLAQSVFTFCYIFLLSEVGERLSVTLKSKIFRSLVQQDLMFFDETRCGILLETLNNDVHEFKSAFKACISQGLRSSAQIAGCMVSLGFISPELTTIMGITLPVLIACGTYVGSILRTLSKEAQMQAAYCTGIAEEALSNIRTTRAFAMERKQCELYEEQLFNSKALQSELALGIAAFQGCTNMFLNGLVLSTLSMGGYLLSCNKLTAGDLMSFLVAVQMIQRSLAQVSLLFGTFVKGISSGIRIFEIIEMEPRVPLASASSFVVPKGMEIPQIEFENVTFAYSTRKSQDVLNNFNLTIPPGKIVALVGSSGSGKSTVASLLLRFYDANEGSVKINGKDIRTFDQCWIRGTLIGYINQEPTLFAASIRENIRYGRLNATDREVEEAAKLANADSFVRSFPDGYDTMVGERGVALSGGQKQRIAIARALLKKPFVLILDEATSALDTVSEKQVQEALDNVMKGRSVLVIAHRLSTIRNADVIVVLDNGNIVEIGDHDSLLNQKGYYWNLMSQQAHSESDEYSNY